ncbi:MAG: hypothetical protein HY323_14460 [Betaproteobacteria bacterium]|nr:hypothetical protein [Betaproteobacteria bacterium]
MPTTRVYKSTDGGAPILNASADGTGNAVLKTILVDGYGALPAAGWTAPFTDGAAITVFRPGAGNRMYLRSTDNYFLGGGPRGFLLRGAESAVGYADGDMTDKFGTSGASALAARYSETSDSTPRAWICVADEGTCYFWVRADGTSPSLYYCFWFGDFYSHVTGDAYRTGLAVDAGMSRVHAQLTQGNGTFSGVLARNYSGLTKNYADAGLVGGTAARADGVNSESALIGNLNYPHDADDRIWLAPLYIKEPSSPPVIRGRLRGMWHWLHPLADVANGDVWSGSGDLAGKDFMLIKDTADINGTTGAWVIETSSTWDTN